MLLSHATPIKIEGQETTLADSTSLMERKRQRVSGCRLARENEDKFGLNAPAESAGSAFIGRSVIFLLLVMSQPFCLFAQTASSGGLPKPAAPLTIGSWKYNETYVAPIGGTDHSTYSITTKDEDGTWTVAISYEFPQGAVTD